MMLSLVLVGGMSGQDECEGCDFMDWDGRTQLVFNADGKVAIADANNNLITGFDYDSNTEYADGTDGNSLGFSPSGNMIALLKGNKIGLISTADGSEIIPFEFSTFGPFSSEWTMSNGLIAVSKGKKWGVYDTLGNVIVPVEYSEIVEWTDDGSIVGNNFIVARKKEDVYIFDVWGSCVLHPKDKDWTTWVEYKDYNTVYAANGSVQVFYNIDGPQFILAPGDTTFSLSTRTTLLEIVKNDKAGVMFRDGDIMLEPIYDDIAIDEYDGNVTVRAYLNGGVTYYNDRGVEIEVPQE